MEQVVVIGGGAAGMAAAIAAADAGSSVVLLEGGKQPGKKILSTGNGRCNLTNLVQTPSCYHTSEGQEEQTAWQVIRRFGCEETKQFFGSLGLYFKNRDGYLYPRSSQAQTVLSALVEGMELRRVDVRTEAKVCGIEKRDDGFLVRTAEQSFPAGRVILCCGGMAAPATGSDGNGYALAKAFGHQVNPPLPALVPLYGETGPLKKAAGVRTDGRITLLVNGRKAASDTGELQITDYGISGIPVFQVSRFASIGLGKGETVEARISFLPEYEEPETFLAHLWKKCGDTLSILNGLFPEKLSIALLKKAGIVLHAPMERIPEKKRAALSELITAYPMTVTKTGDFDRAQVTAGGVRLSEVDLWSMESKLVPGLQFAGEILDVDGICGGYNLQWAWASGVLAGKRGNL